MSKSADDPLGDYADKDTRDPIGDHRDPIGDPSDRNSRDPISGLADNDTRDPIGDFAEQKTDGSVGYCKPPRNYTWKAGQSGNPKGRKKGSKNESTILHELLNRKIRIRDGGKWRSVTILEAIHTNFVDDILKTKNTKSAAFILNRYGSLVSGETPPSEISQDDQEVLKAFAERAAAERGKKDKDKS